MLRSVVAALVAAFVVPLSALSVASAEPATSARVERVESVTPRRSAVFVYSPSMQRVVQVQVLHPAGDAPRPSLYLLDGVSAGAESDYRESTWTQRTDIVDFFADKNVNVVLPVGGTASYYTDWLAPDPVLGVNAWETFLTKELPPLIDARFAGNGVNAVGGLSMGATGAASLIARNPDLYRGVAALSGCLDTSKASAQDAVRGTVAYKGGNPDNMWGAPGDPAWAAHDPYVLAERLRGKEIFISTGNGLPGPYDVGPDAEALDVGGPLEVGAFVCTIGFDRRLRELRIPATIVYRPYGTHSWPYWQDDLRTAWPTLERALGLD
ncbi:alpha/beta hydrolase [Rhodococcus indonesiensis]